LFDVPFIALVGHDRKDIDSLVVDTFTLLVPAEADPTADLLALLNFRCGLVERADLKDIRVIPTLAQCAMREDEADRFIE